MEPRKDELRAAARIAWTMSEVLVALLLLCLVSAAVLIPSGALFFMGQVVHSAVVNNPIDITQSAVVTTWLWTVGVYGALVTAVLMLALYGKVPFTVKDEDFITLWTMFAFAFPLVFGLLAPAMW